MFLGFSEVSEEIHRHELIRITLAEEQQVTLASCVQLKIQACQDECSRLEAALAKVEVMCAEYRQAYTEGAQVDITSYHVYLSFHLSIFSLSIYLSTCLSICLRVYLSLSLSLFLSIYRSILHTHTHTHMYVHAKRRITS